MHLQNSCFTCGSPLGDRFDIFRLICKKKINNELTKSGIVPTKIAITEELQLDFTEELKKLGYVNYCCITVTTVMLFHEYY